MPEHTIPASLVEQIKSGRAVLVVGAGVGVPSWKQLLEAMNAELAGGSDHADAPDAHEADDSPSTDRADAASVAAARDVAKLLHKGSLARAAGFLARSLGEERCDRIVADTWAAPGEVPAVARALAALPFWHVWTTFPGDVLERAMAEASPAGWPTPVVVTYQRAGDIRPRRRTLLKLLGDFESYVVTPRSVRGALANAAALRDYARRCYAEGTLVLVGFRYGDPDLAALLDRLLGMFEAPERQHYLIGSGMGPVTVDELAHEHHIEVINLAGKGADDAATSALIEYLDALRAACEEAGATLAHATPADDDLDGWLDLLRATAGDRGAGPDARAERARAREHIARIEAEARAAGDTERVIDVLVGRVETEDAAAERGVLLRQLARVFEVEVGDLPQAFTALTAALREDPTSASAFEEAARLAEATGSWSELVADVSAVAGEVADDRLAATYWARLGEWYHQRLDHADYAVAAYRQALRRDPACLPAYAGLAEVYRVQQRWAELADVLVQHVELEDDANRKIDLYLALGDLCETQLAASSRAIEAYQAAADLDPGQDDALVALERLYRRDERWGKLATVLELRAEILDGVDGQRASAMRRELATLRADKLGDVEGAIGKYEAALEADPTDVEALRALRELYERVSRTDDYLRTLERLIEAAPEGERPPMLRRLAAEVEDREGGRERAVECYVQILDIEPAAEDAYRELERLLRADERWEDLAETYERHTRAVTAPAVVVELYGRLAEVYEARLGDPERAIAAHVSARGVQPDHRESLAALARLYEQTGAWDRAVAVLVEHAELEDSRGAALWYRAGGIGAERGDVEAAERHLEKALAIDPRHAGALTALAELNEARGNLATAVKMLSQAAANTPGRPERVALLSRAARLADGALHDRERALALWREVLEHDPEHAEAGARAAEHLMRAERWADAAPILEMLTRGGPPGPRGDGGGAAPREVAAYAAHQYALGRARAALGAHEEAVACFRAAVEADPDHDGAARALADAIYDAAIRDAASRANSSGGASRAESSADGASRAESSADGASRAESADGASDERWAEANTRYRDVLRRLGDDPPAADATEVWYRLGVIARRLGNETRAEAALRRALERTPHHAPSLAQLAELAIARQDWATVVEVKRAEIEAAAEGDAPADRDRARLLADIGQLLYEKVGDAEGALAAYDQALALRPGSRSLLHRVLDIHTDRGAWTDAIETLTALADKERDDAVRAKYHFTTAVIARHELEDHGLAALHFDLALDSAPDMGKAFDALDEMLTEQEDWKRLAGAYRRMLKRLGESAPRETLLHLWTRLGDICADHLDDSDSAIAAYEVASSMDPDDMDRHEQLADLYLEAGEARRADAIDEIQVLVRHAPDRVELYRALSNLYRDERQVDKAYCLAQALVFLGAASDDEAELYERHRPDEFVFARRRLTDELWQQAVVHRDEDRRLGAIFSSLIGSIAATTAQPPSAFNLDDADRVDPDADSHLVSKVFKYGANILALDPEPRLYLQRKSAEGIRAANTKLAGSLAPSVLVGGQHIAKQDERELAFEVGKRLAYFRPERYIEYAAQTLPKLESALIAALVASGVHAGEPPDAAARLAAHITRTVPKAVLEQVRAVARKLGSASPSSLIAAWRTAADLTANRIGLILCNDLDTAARLVATEPAGVSTLTAKDRLRDLLTYSVSEDYFAVRRHLGLHLRGDHE